MNRVQNNSLNLHIIFRLVCPVSFFVYSCFVLFCLFSLFKSFLLFNNCAKAYFAQESEQSWFTAEVFISLITCKACFASARVSWCVRVIKRCWLCVANFTESVPCPKAPTLSLLFWLANFATSALFQPPDSTGCAVPPPPRRRVASDWLSSLRGVIICLHMSEKQNGCWMSWKRMQPSWNQTQTAGSCSAVNRLSIKKTQFGTAEELAENYHKCWQHNKQTSYICVNCNTLL